MAKYRRKALEVEAFKWTGGVDQTEDPEWIVEAIKKGKVAFGTDEELKVTCMYIDTGVFKQSESVIVKANIGDYIIKFNNGVIHQCDPETFERIHEKC